MSQANDISLKLSIYELVIILTRIAGKDDSLLTTTCDNIVQEARKFARKDD